MTDVQNTYVQTNRLLFNTLKDNITKEKKAISRLTAKEIALRNTLDTESKRVLSGAYPEKKKELSFKIRNYHQELKSTGAELSQKKQGLDHSLSSFKALKRERSHQHKQQEHAEKELEKELKQLVLSERQAITKDQHEKFRHGHHIERIQAEKEKVHAKISKELEHIEATLRKDKREQENKVLAVEKSIEELSRKKKYFQHQALAKSRNSQERIKAFQAEKALIEAHLLKVKDHLLKNKPGLHDSVFNSLVKNWFQRQGQLQDKEKVIYNKAEAQEREIDHKVESMAHQLRILHKKLSAERKRVQIKEKEFQQLTDLEQNQGKLSSALKEMREWL